MKQELAIYCDYIHPVQKAGVVRMRPVIEQLQQIPGLQLRIVYAEGVPKPADNTRYRKAWFKPGSNADSNIVRIFKEILLGAEFFIRILFSRRKVVYLSSPPFFTILLASFACRLRKMKYILDLRDKYPDVFFESGLMRETSLIGRILKSFEKQLVKNANIVATVTPELVKKISLLAKKEVLYIPNGYSEGFLPGLTKAPQFTIIFHGNIGRFQDIELLLSLAAYLESEAPDIRIVAIGEGSKDHMLRDTTCRNLSYLGQLPLEVIAQHVNRAHMGVSFRTNDQISIHSMPVKVFEYIGAGLPIVITPVSEAGDMVGELQLGRQFRSEDQDEIFQFIIALSNDQTLYKQYASNVAAHRHKFSRKELAVAFAEKINMLFEESTPS